MLSYRLTTLTSHLILNEWLDFFDFFFNLAVATWNCDRLGARSVYTIQPCTSLRYHFMQSYIHRVHACLAVTCHLHFWQNDRYHFTCYCGNMELERIQKWESAHGENIFPPLLLGLKPATFWPRVRRSALKPFPLPGIITNRTRKGRKSAIFIIPNPLLSIGRVMRPRFASPLRMDQCSRTIQAALSQQPCSFVMSPGPIRLVSLFGTCVSVRAIERG